MGHDPGTYTDAARETATGVLYEYTAGCEPYKYRTCSTYSHMRWYRAECHILYEYVWKDERGESTVNMVESMLSMAENFRMD